MSQKKVDSYKAGKAGRSKASRKEKMIDKLEILAWIAICVDGLDFPRMQRSRQNRSLLLQRQ